MKAENHSVFELKLRLEPGLLGAAPVQLGARHRRNKADILEN
jgi:hypothetical protein